MTTPKKILIIDDEPKIVKALCDAFRFEEGFVVEGLTDGAESIQYLQSTPAPDLVILDWRLKGAVQGRDVLMYVRENKPETPVWVVTASIHFLDEINSLKPSASFLKPLPELKERIVRFLTVGAWVVRSDPTANVFNKQLIEVRLLNKTSTDLGKVKSAYGKI